MGLDLQIKGQNPTKKSAISGRLSAFDVVYNLCVTLFIISGLASRFSGPGKRNKDLKVFIAEDSPIIVKGLFAMLSEVSDVEIVGRAETAAEAVRRIRALDPDAVILNMKLREGNGLDVLKEIKQGKRPPTVIVITTYAYLQLREKCLELGAEFFFDKSREFEKIAPTLEGMIRRRRISGEPDMRGSSEVKKKRKKG